MKFKAYLNYFKLRIITNLQYRTAAVAGILTQFFFGFVFILIYLAFYSSSGNASVPMNWDELVTYLWLQQAFFALMYPFVHDHELLKMIRNGNIAYELIRPQNFYVKYFIKMLSDRFVSCILRCLPILIIGYILPEPYHLSLPYSKESFLIFIVGLLVATLLVTALSMIVHMSTILFIDSKGMISTYSIIAELFTGGIVPLPFLPNFLIKIGEYLPFRYLNDFVYRTYSGSIGISTGLNMLLSSTIWTIVAIVFGILLTNRVLKKAVIQGG